MVRNSASLAGLLLLLLLSLPDRATPTAFADGVEKLGAPAVLPVKEVTVFKDGHALLLREGTLPVAPDGAVGIDRLPTPVLGTFWGFVDQAGVDLASVKASRHTVEVERTALDIPTLLAANVGAAVVVTDVEGHTFHAKVLGFPTRTAEELDRTSSDETPHLPQRGNLVLLQGDEGVRVMRVDRIRGVVFRDDHHATLAQEELRNRLELRLRAATPLPERAKVGFLALEDGLRWIPEYRVDLQEGGKARLRLQATLVDDCTDLEDADVNLVIGVPTFAFAGTMDPIALEAGVMQVAQRMPQSQSRLALSNAIQGQVVAGMSERREAPPPPPAVAGSAGHEDLYVFHVAHVSLRKGERLVLPVAEATLSYDDVYTLDEPFSPPPEVWPAIAQNLFRRGQEADAARLLAASRVTHVVRIHDEGPYPLTTAPALLFQDGQVLAQGLLTYTSVGNSVDLAVTAAVDVHVKKEDKEVDRKIDAVKWMGSAYAEVDMNGTLSLTNYKDKAVHLEVTRSVLGSVTSADHGGETTGVNAWEEGSWTTWRPPFWWSWYSWPTWWYHFNGVGRIRWSLDLEPGKSVDLGYAWRYYWPR